jgi:DNA mismatch repair protein MutL
MMPTIRVLPDLLVNKIAAGEVVERPASVAKELLENAIDAEADHIQLAIEDGGKRLIRVTDDGCGMSAEDLRLAVTPHATSKLADEDDLFRISTMGFRGEALPSIGAVSHLRIVSRPHHSDEGAEIRVSAEKVESCQAAGAPPGTSVEVRDLFFNVPARRKFLRATSTETGHVSEQFARIALAHPDVGFEMISGKRVSQRLPADQERLERIAALFGAELAEELLHIDRDERGLAIQGYAAPPARSKATAAGQYVFVNGRYIRDRVLNYAVREAYRGLMEHNRYPIVFLFLALDPSQLDVNVHPTKIEVRWQDTNLIRSQVLSALRETFLRTDLTPALQASAGSAKIDETDREAMRHDIASHLKTLTPTPAAAPFRAAGASPQTSRTPGADPQTSAAPPASPPTSPEDAADLWRSFYDSPTGTEPGASATGQPLRCRPTIQLHNTYLVTETDDGLMIIDQHALHERILYEQLRQRLTTGPLESQRLLLPETLEVTPKQLAVLEEQANLLHQLGIEVTPFGSNSVAVQAFPSLLANADVRGFMRDLIDKLDIPEDQPHTEVLIHKLLDMMACKAAVKAGDPLTPQEIDALIANKHLIEKASNCPHGRPTTLQMNLRELEKQFKRT